jgi:hypothetical protein
MNQTPLTPAFMDFERKPLDCPPKRTPGSPPGEVILSKSERNKIRAKNQLEQEQFKATTKAAAKAALIEISRGGESERNKALLLANDKLRIELARYMQKLREQKCNIRQLKALIKAGNQPAQGAV